MKIWSNRVVNALYWAFLVFIGIVAYVNGHIVSFITVITTYIVALWAIDVIRYIRGIMTIRRVLREYPYLTYIALTGIEFSDRAEWDKKLTTRLVRM